MQPQRRDYFTRSQAPVGGTPGALALYFGPATVPVDVTTPVGATGALLRVPPVQPGPLRVFADGALPPGGEVRRRHGGALVGVVETPGP